MLKDDKIRKLVEEKVAKLVNIGATNLWGHLRDWVLRACDELCGKKRGGGDVKEICGVGMLGEGSNIKKDAQKAMCRNSPKGNKNRYKKRRIKQRKCQK